MDGKLDPDPRWQADTVTATPGGARTPKAQDAAPAEGEVSPFDPPRRRFAEGAELGRGGMGRVFEAVDTALGRLVAIKQSLVDDAALIARFEREVRITARLQHPGIVPILDAGRDDAGRPYYVMRKIDGRPLADLITEARRVEDRLALVPSVLAAVDAMAYAHARGVIHRDLKPWNVLVGAFGETLVIDWGLAREVDGDDALAVAPPSEPPDDGLTRAGTAFGTPGFMAPEQARGESLDRRADVYALGATLYHVLAGVPPFAGIAPTLAIDRVAEGATPDLAAVAAAEAVPAALTAIVAKALAPKVEDRYASAGELAADLRRFLAGQLVAAHHYTARERLARWARRHRVAIAIAAAAVIALAITATLAIRNVVAARDAAQVARDREAARADDMLVERADAIATRDPVRALALLAQLPAGSPAWGRARAVAATAAAAGPGWGRALSVNGTFSQLAAAPDGSDVAYTDGPRILVVAPDLRASPRELVRLDGDVTSLEWIEGGAALAAAVGSTVIRVARDGTIRTLHAGEPNGGGWILPATPDRRLFATVGGHLRELDLGGGPSRDLGVALTAQRIDGGVVVRDSTELKFLPDGGAPIAVASGDVAYTFDAAANVILARTDREVRAFTGGPAGFVETGRWSVGALWCGVLDGTIVCVEPGTIAWLRPGQDAARVAIPGNKDSPLHNLVGGGFVATPDGLVVAAAGGLVLVREHMQPVVIAAHGEELASFAMAGRYAVGLSRAGVLRSWDLSALVPQILVTPGGAEPVSIDAAHVWLTGNDHLSVVDLATGEIRDLAGPVEEEHGLICADGAHAVVRIDAGRRYAMRERARLDLVVISTLARSLLSDTVERGGCSPSARWLALATDNALEIRPTAAPDQVSRRFALPAPPSILAAGDAWVAILDTAGELARYGRESGARTATTGGKAALIAVDEAGRVAVLRDDAIELWSGVEAEPPRVVADHIRPRSLAATPAGFVVETRDRSLIVIDPASGVATYDAGSGLHPWFAHDAPYGVIGVDGRLATVDVRDGTLVRRPWSAGQAKISDDGMTIAASLPVGRLIILRDRVPAGGDALRAWVADATNARVAPHSAVLSWPK